MVQRRGRPEGEIVVRPHADSWTFTIVRDYGGYHILQGGIPAVTRDFETIIRGLTDHSYRVTISRVD